MKLSALAISALALQGSAVISSAFAQPLVAHAPNTLAVYPVNPAPENIPGLSVRDSPIVGGVNENPGIGNSGPSQQNKNKTGEIAGITLGGIAGLTLLVGGGYLAKRKYAVHQENKRFTNDIVMA